MEDALSEVLGLCVFWHGHSLLRTPRPRGPWETGQPITHGPVSLRGPSMSICEWLMSMIEDQQLQLPPPDDYSLQRPPRKTSQPCPTLYLIPASLSMSVPDFSLFPHHLSQWEVRNIQQQWMKTRGNDFGNEQGWVCKKVWGKRKGKGKNVIILWSL